MKRMSNRIVVVPVYALVAFMSWNGSTAYGAEPKSNQPNDKSAWHEFRGDFHDGTALNQNPPTSWSEEKNLKWKCAIHGRGWSSPVVSGNNIWLTTATEDGLKMSAICVAMDSGKIIHDFVVFENKEVQPDFHVTNSYASCTPVVDDQYAWIHFGAYGTACIDQATGKKIWERRDLPCNHFRGPGSSPILYKDLLIFHMDGFDHQYVIALNKKSGETVWKKNREIEYGTENGDYYKAYSTPLVINVGGQDQLVSSTSKATLVLDPSTGNEIWRVRYNEFSATARPLFDGKYLYLNTGFGKAQMLCIEADGKGDVTDTKVRWGQKKGIGSKPSQVLVDNRLFSVTDDGVVSRIDTSNGEIAWQKRIGGNFSSSLVATKKHLFALDHDGKGFVFTLADEPELVSENALPDGCRASPAIVNDCLIIRTVSHLYCFQAQK